MEAVVLWWAADCSSALPCVTAVCGGGEDDLLECAVGEGEDVSQLADELLEGDADWTAMMRRKWTLPFSTVARGGGGDLTSAITQRAVPGRPQEPEVTDVGNPSERTSSPSRRPSCCLPLQHLFNRSRNSRSGDTVEFIRSRPLSNGESTSMAADGVRHGRSRSSSANSRGSDTTRPSDLSRSGSLEREQVKRDAATRGSKKGNRGPRSFTSPEAGPSTSNVEATGHGGQPRVTPKNKSKASGASPGTDRQCSRKSGGSQKSEDTRNVGSTGNDASRFSRSAAMSTDGNSSPTNGNGHGRRSRSTVSNEDRRRRSATQTGRNRSRSLLRTGTNDGGPEQRSADAQHRSRSLSLSSRGADANTTTSRHRREASGRLRSRTDSASSSSSSESPIDFFTDSGPDSGNDPRHSSRSAAVSTDGDGHGGTVSNGDRRRRSATPTGRNLSPLRTGTNGGAPEQRAADPQQRPRSSSSSLGVDGNTATSRHTAEASHDGRAALNPTVQLFRELFARHLAQIQEENVDCPCNPRGTCLTIIKDDITPRRYTCAANSSADSTQSPSESEEKCVICMADYVDGEMVKALSCKHQFHSRCIDPWLEGNPGCPSCRDNLNRAKLRSLRASNGGHDVWATGSARLRCSRPARRMASPVAESCPIQ